MTEAAGVSVLVVTDKDDHVATIDRSLREAGHPTHCRKLATPAELEQALPAGRPELILLFAGVDSDELAYAARMRDQHNPSIPLLVVAPQVDEDAIATAMLRGARDTVSLDNIERFKSVATRELRAFRLEKALESVMSSAQQYKNELNSLKNITVDAIADIQEGIIVNANPAWLELFGFPEGEDLTGYPIMDFCAAADRPTLKGGLSACQKGKWADEKLCVSGVAADGSEFQLRFKLEKAEHDGDPAVRMLVAPERVEEPTPDNLIEQAMQRCPSTGLYNRTHLLATLEARIAEAPKGGVRALAYIRPDKFSKVADDVGPLGTEKILAQLADILRSLAQPKDIYGRFGGTDFVVLLERGTMGDAIAWTEQFTKSVTAAVFEYEKHTTAVTCSLGLLRANKDSALSELLRDAQIACRSARKDGGDRVTLVSAGDDEDGTSNDDTTWVPRIRGALMENRLRLEHQPVGSLNKDIDGAFDTLVRMLDEEGNTILPNEFMPAAERTGLSKNLDRWVIGASLSYCAAGKAKLVFVRLSRDSLLDDSLSAWLKSQTAQANVHPGKVCFQIDEALVGKHLGQTQALANTLRGAGFLFAVEHFGRREDSLRILEHVPMDYVKIDGSLMQGLHKNSGAQDQLRELSRAARNHSIHTIAERVQDANTMAVLWQLGIEYIQGAYVAAQEIVIEDTSRSTTSTRALELDENGTPRAAEATA